jgi:hypothetical protein
MKTAHIVKQKQQAVGMIHEAKKEKRMKKRKRRKRRNSNNKNKNKRLVLEI